MRLVLCWILVGMVFCDSHFAEEGIPIFSDVTKEARLRFQHINGDALKKDYIFEAKGGGVGFFDYDNDGWMDVLCVQGSSLKALDEGSDQKPALYRNLRDGTFEDLTEQSGFKAGLWGMGVASGDFDNDGFVDVYLTGLGMDHLYRNRGDGTFEDVTAESGIAASTWTTSAAFGDFDGDGFLDLYVAGYLDYGPHNLPPKTSDCTYLGTPVLCGPRGLKGARDYLYRNNGDGTFSDVTQESGASDQQNYFGLGVVFSDLNNDSILDILVGNDATPNLVFINQGNSKFDELGFISGLAVSGDGGEQASMGIDAADYDNDGLLDVFMTHFAGDYSTLYHNEGNMFFRDVSREVGLEQPEWNLVAWGTRFMDINLDGWKDLFHANGHVYPYLLDGNQKEAYRQPPSLYLNLQNGGFRDVGSLAGEDFKATDVGRGVAFGDYDNDGDIDVLIANMNGSPRLLRNDRTDSNHWVMFRLEGKGNRDAIGARVTVNVGELKQVWEIKRTVGIYSSSDPRAHFGIGEAEKVNRVEVSWASGRKDVFEGLPANRHYLIREGGGLEREPFK